MFSSTNGSSYEFMNRGGDKCDVLILSDMNAIYVKSLHDSGVFVQVAPYKFSSMQGKRKVLEKVTLQEMSESKRPQTRFVFRRDGVIDGDGGIMEHKARKVQ